MFTFTFTVGSVEKFGFLEYALKCLEVQQSYSHSEFQIEYYIWYINRQASYNIPLSRSSFRHSHYIRTTASPALSPSALTRVWTNFYAPTRLVNATVSNWTVQTVLRRRCRNNGSLVASYNALLELMRRCMPGRASCVQLPTFVLVFSGSSSSLEDCSTSKYRSLFRLFKCQTPLHGHRLRTCCTTPPTGKLTTILQLLVQQIEFVVPEVVELLWACPLAVLYNVCPYSRCPCSGVWH